MRHLMFFKLAFEMTMEGTFVTMKTAFIMTIHVVGKAAGQIENFTTNTTHLCTVVAFMVGIQSLCTPFRFAANSTAI